MEEEILEEIKMELLLKTGDYFTLDVYLKEFEEKRKGKD